MNLSEALTAARRKCACGTRVHECQTRCRDCADKHRRKQARNAAKLVSRGLCARGCGRTCHGEKNYCSPCIDVYIARNRKRRAAFRNAGKCRDCGERAEAGHIRCFGCAQAHVAYNEKRKHNLKARGRCISCQKPRHPHSKTYCLKCHVRRLCADRLGDAKHAQLMLARLEEQDHVCYLCRTAEIRVGVNAEIEHMYPVSRAEFAAESKDPEFWAWACQPCNGRKGDLTAPEFWALHPFDRIAV